MNATTDPHQAFEELAAGYAVNALEPADEQAFLDHLEACDRCVDLVARYSGVAGDLATLSVVADPPADLWSDIESALDAEGVADAGPAVDEPPRVVIDLDAEQRRRRQFSARTLTAAAAAVAVAGIAGWQVATHITGNGPGRDQKLLSACQRSTTCHAVRLVGAGGRGQLGVVLVNGQHATLVDNRLSAIDPAQQTYVLWQLPRDGRPIGVVAFAVTRGHPRPIVNATLPLSYGNTSAIAVSRETGTAIPAAPSTTLAVAPAT
jgi:anti-sigma-K factor RskA